jgi:hypothetical protein
VEHTPKKELRQNAPAQDWLKSQVGGGASFSRHTPSASDAHYPKVLTISIVRYLHLILLTRVKFSLRLILTYENLSIGEEGFGKGGITSK